MQTNRPPEIVYHGTDSQFEVFDQSNTLGAHFGTHDAAIDRLRSTGRALVELMPYEDDDGVWWAVECSTHNVTPFEHGPFSDEDATLTFIECFDKKRQPLAFELDVYRPLIMPDLGVWTFQAVTRFLQENHTDIDCSNWNEAWNISNEQGWLAIKNSLEASGYDCISYVNETEDKGSISWIVWDNQKIHRDWRSRMEMNPLALDLDEYPAEL